MTEAYCMRCKKRIEVKDEKRYLTKAGTGMIKGTCPLCNTKVSKFCSKHDIK